MSFVYNPLSSVCSEVPGNSNRINKSVPVSILKRIQNPARTPIHCATLLNKADLRNLPDAKAIT